MPGPHRGETAGERRRRLATEYGGWIAAAAGAVLCVLGWYGVSGERFAERQIPFLASLTIPGAALIVAGAVLLAAQERDAPTAARVEDLHRLLVATDTDTVEAGADTADDGTVRGGGPAAQRDGGTDAEGATDGADGRHLTVPGGTVHHRPGCPLVEGKEAREVGADEIGERGLRPCPVCSAPPDDTGDEPRDGAGDGTADQLGGGTEDRPGGGTADRARDRAGGSGHKRRDTGR